MHGECLQLLLYDKQTTRINSHKDHSTGLLWGITGAEIQIPSVDKNPELKVLVFFFSPSLKPGVGHGQYLAMHATPTAKDLFLANSTLPVLSPAFFLKPLPSVFVCSLWLTPVPIGPAE